MGAHAEVSTLKFEDGLRRQENSFVIVEKSVLLTVNGEPWISFLCTPTDLKELAAGFLYNESIIASTAEIANIHVCESNEIIDVWLTRDVEKPNLMKRTSGCTGGISFDKEEEALPFINEQSEISPEEIKNILFLLFQGQEFYKKSGGVHTSALCDKKQIIVLNEDIGRHNSLDKIAGQVLLNKIEVSPRIIITTGRISSEMLIKAARLKAPILISRTSPSSLSIDLANRIGITLIGYARRDRFTVYTHAERVGSDS